MKNVIGSRITAVLVASALSASLWGQTPSTKPPVDTEQLWFTDLSLCQSTARRKDPALLPRIREMLQSPTQRYGNSAHSMTVCALVALGRIGTEEALAVLESVAGTLKPYYRESYVPVIRARLRADMEFPAVHTREQWEQKVAFFLQEAELAREALQEALKNHPQFGDPMVYPSRGVVAVRVLLEMAEAAYANGVKEALGFFQGLALERDDPSRVRYQLIPLNQRQRIEWLIHSLTHKPARRFRDRYELLALWRCGEAAIPAILAKIEELSSQKPKEEAEVVRVNVGIANLLEVLAGFDDPRVEPTLERFARENFKAEEFLRRHRKGLRGVVIMDW
ncbi:MAG: hypothetical protein K6U12_13020 [Armatimonadetes bacterium]|nr:hypothetical protein [Armatimonadota bacterium]